ncbi:MAG: ABC transporter permease [Thermoplasmata archaeon]|jgi:ABC-2 type transport system permease protein|nr:ABC transporter permease [Thermoplasmata archaeon]
MRADRTLAVARRALTGLRHDRRTIAFLLLIPLFMITLFGYTFGGELKDVRICVVDLDEGADNQTLGAVVVAALTQSGTVEVVDRTSSLDDGVQKVRDGDVWATVYIPSDFSEKALAATEAITSGEPVTALAMATLYLDSSNPNIASAIVKEVIVALQSVSVVELGLTAPIGMATVNVYGEDAEFIDFFAPGVMGLAAMMVTFMLSIITFVHERSTHTLDRVLTTPVTEGEVVAGYAMAFGVVALIQSTVILVAAVLLFDIQIVGNPLLVLVVIFLLGVGNQGLGFLLSSLAKSEFQAVQFMPVILFPSILLAGVFWPLEAVPELLRPVSYFVPLTYAVDGCRSVMIRGWGIGDVWLQVLILIAFAVVMLSLSAVSLKRRR